MYSTIRWASVALLALIGAACGASTPEPTSVETPGAVSASPRTFALGEFPEFPSESLPRPLATALQAALDTAVAAGIVEGVTASVIVAGLGNWTGVAGIWNGAPLTTESRLRTHSAGKNFTAAQILQLVDEGKLALDDLASDHLPRELRFFNANGATIREVLAMRSGIPSIPDTGGEESTYPAEEASTVVQVFKTLSEPKVRPGVETRYASTNFVLLGAIIQEASGQSLSQTLRSDVLNQPGLDGIVYTVKNALAGDGWGVESTPSSLARWAYELYGGSVISDASLREMTDFQGAWYGLGTMDFSSDYGTLAVGHDGSSSATTCCSQIRLVALPAEGTVISVQANTEGPWGLATSLTQELRSVLSR